MTLDRIEFAFPKRAWRGSPSRGTQGSEAGSLIRSTAGQTLRAIGDGGFRATWPYPSHSFDIPTTSSGQTLHKPSARSLESANDPVRSKYPIIKYEYILGGIIAGYLSFVILVALAAAGVFSSGSDDSSNKWLPLSLLLAVVFDGVLVGVIQRTKEILRR